MIDRRFVRWLTCLLILAGAPRVVAQESKDKEPDKGQLGVAVTFGWQGKVPAAKWTPITVAVSPGETPLSGTVTASYQQGSGQARTTVPFAATPNATTPVHIFAWLPDTCQKVDLSLANERGAVQWSQTFETIPDRFSQPLPGLVPESSPIMLLVGRSTLFESTRDWPMIVGATNSTGQLFPSTMAESSWSHLVAGRAEPATLPRAWIAYDGVAVLVATPDSESPPDVRAVEAMHTWVASGGRLVVRVDAVGDAWRAWVPETLAATIDVLPPRPAPLPDQARQAIDRIGVRLRAIREGAQGSLGVSSADGPIPAPADSLIVRPIAASKWVTHWSTADGGLVVETPYGFGSVLLLGFDPGKTTSTLSSLGAGAVWRSAMEPVVADVLDEVAIAWGHRSRTWNSGMVSGQNAANTLLERLATVPGVGTAVFLIIVVSIFILALLVGPIDFFLLRRLRSLQRSWLTALAWIAVASAAAFAGPRLIRTESTRVNRMSIEDTISGGAGLVEPAAFRAGLTGVYAGESGIAVFTQADRASWWRGSAVRYINENPVAGSGVIPITQEAAGGAQGSQRGGPLLQLPLAVWTFRTLADESNPPASIRAKVRSTESRGAKGWTALIFGLPPGAQVTRAALRVGDKWVTIDRETRIRRDASGFTTAEAAPPVGAPTGTMDGGVWTGVFPEKNADPAPPISWGEVDSFAYDDGTGFVDDRPGVITRLSGPSRRDQAIQRLTATDSWAAIYLEVKTWPHDTPIQWTFEGEQTRILRVLTPLQED